MNHALSVAPALAPSERRRHPRHSLEGEVVVTILSPRLWPEIPGSILDASKDGIAVLVDQTIPSGCMVKIRAKGSVIIGEVRHAVPVSYRYRIGVAVIEMYFSRSALRPAV